jgi:hydroxymethylbilane synthase
MTVATRVGTRGSPLALVQTRAVIAKLRAAHLGLHEPGTLTECVIRTTGDAVQDRPLAEIGGKGLFAKEIHEALSAGRIDLAVHSLKDLETELPPGIALGCTLAREDPRDVLLLAPGLSSPDPHAPFAGLPTGSAIGTASARRQAQVLHLRPDLRVVTFRGNVQTRLAKLETGACQAALLALAGLRRLGLAPGRALPLNPELMVPAACQGIIAVTARADDAERLALLAGIEDEAARAAATAERAMLAALGGSCRTPIAAHARVLPDHALELTGLVARRDGSFLLKRRLTGPAADAARLGAALGEVLKAGSPADIFA